MAYLGECGDCFRDKTGHRETSIEALLLSRGEMMVSGTKEVAVKMVRFSQICDIIKRQL